MTPHKASLDRRTAAVTVGLALVYFITAKLGLMLASIHASATAVWPPTGISLAAMLLLGAQAWPGIFVGAFCANLLTAGSIFTSLGIAGGNTLEAVTAAYLVSRFAKGRRLMEVPLDIFKFAALAGVVSTAISATTGVTALSLGGFAEWNRYGEIWLTWWMGDASGCLLVTPVILLWADASPRRFTREDAIALVESLIPIAGLGLLLFGGIIPGKQNYPLDFLFFPALVWTALRFSLRETATASLLFSGIAIWGTLHGFGPFANFSRNTSLLFLHAFLAVTTLAALAVASLVSERKRTQMELKAAYATAENKVRERTAELMKVAEGLLRSNTELEQFATTVAHELQEPMRKILTFGSYVKMSDPKMEKAEAEYIEKMETAARRMQRLVEDILQLARVTSNTKPVQVIDLNAVAKEVSADFESRIAETGGSIDIGPLPSVKADASQMRQVFANLISNAYKFRKKDRPLTISIRADAASKGFTNVSVKDNGIGFDAENKERIFKPFHRLHRRGEYEGTGMGLTICKRIMMRHGGDIYAAGAPDAGATFTLVLPVWTESGGSAADRLPRLADPALPSR